MLRGFPDARVVIVHDDADQAAGLQRLLERAGLQKVYTTTDAFTAVDLARGVDADLLLLDLQLPEAGGYDILEEMATRPSMGYVPVIVLTSDTAPTAAHRALTLGANDFVRKPFDETAVVLRVRNLLLTSDLFKALRSQNTRLADELDQRRELDRELARNRREIEERIDRAVANADLTMVFQPIVRVPSREIVGVEALARFPGPPQRPPDQWFNEAAAIGRGPDLELVAIHKAIAALGQLPPGQLMGINVSPQLVIRGDLDALCDSDVCPRLVLELTEHVAITDYEPLMAALEPLRKRGAWVAIDDAGAGYATLQHVLALQPDIIKLDRSLTSGIDSDAARRALASALIAFAAETSAKLVAEGVETREELDVLTGLGAELVQGFYLAQPGPLANT